MILSKLHSIPVCWVSPNTGGFGRRGRPRRPPSALPDQNGFKPAQRALSVNRGCSFAVNSLAESLFLSRERLSPPTRAKLASTAARLRRRPSGVQIPRTLSKCARSRPRSTRVGGPEKSAERSGPPSSILPRCHARPTSDCAASWLARARPTSDARSNSSRPRMRCSALGSLARSG